MPTADPIGDGPGAPAPGAHDTAATFFCVPGIGGNVLNLQGLAQRLGPTHRLVALRTGLGSGPLRGIEDLASHVSETVLRHACRGPLLLGGYSGGAAIAFEMARQLSDAGHPIGLLALIDTRRPGWRTTPRAAPRVAARFIGNIPGWIRDDLAQSSARQTWRNIRRHLRQAAHGKATLDGIIDLARYPDDMKRAMQREFDLLEAYRPRPWAGRITFLRAQTQPLLLLHDEDALGWTALAGGGIDVITIPGNHLTIMREPHVGQLAAELSARMTAATAHAMEAA